MFKFYRVWPGAAFWTPKVTTLYNTLEGFVRKVAGRGAAVHFTGAAPAVRRMLLAHGAGQGASFHKGLKRGVAAARADVAKTAAA